MPLNHLLWVLEIMLSLAAVAFYLVRVVTPEFTGLGWIAAAFAGASFCPVMVLNAQDLPNFDFLGILILVTFAFVHLAVTTLTDRPSRVPQLTIMLVLGQMVVSLCVWRGLIPATAAYASRDLFLILQAAQTAMAVRTTPKGTSQIPRWFLLVPLFVVAVTTAIQFALIAHALASSTPPELFLDREVELREVLVGAFVVFSFGYFWRTTLVYLVRLEESGGTDALTQLLNRRHFLKRCDQEIETYRRRQQVFSMMMVDIDHFKSINDTYGHPVGDIVILDVVDRVRDAVRGIDVIGRWGGEEFIVLLKDCPLERAAIAAERLRLGVERMDCSAAPIRFGSQRPITVSVGIADFNGQETILDLISRADQGLYKAKTGGRNRVGVVLESTEEAVEEDVAAVSRSW